MDILPIETILKSHNITPEQFETISKHPQFTGMLEEAIRAWGSSTNTAERVRLKFLAILEESAPEMFARLHDKAEALNHKVELYKTIMRGAGVGVSSGDTAGSAADRVQITINMGEGKELSVTKDVTPRVTAIEHEEV